MTISQSKFSNSLTLSEVIPIISPTKSKKREVKKVYLLYTIVLIFNEGVLSLDYYTIFVFLSNTLLHLYTHTFIHSYTHTRIHSYIHTLIHHRRRRMV